MLNMVYGSDPILSKTLSPVTKFDDELKSFIKEMFETMDNYNGVGLAANQVGVDKRIFVIDTRTKGERLAFINPEIIETSDDNVPYNEGCLSFPNVFRDIYRPSHVTVSAKDVNGRSFIVKADGLLARAIQHENDHLNGKTFISHLSDDEEREALSEFRRKNKRLLKGLKLI